MKIARVLNNNAVTVLDDQRQELVIMGKGIAYKKQSGDLLEDDKVEKIFRLESKELSQKLKVLLEDIPIEYIDISDEIIQYAQAILNCQFHDSVYISLTDHIHFAIERHRKGQQIKNALLLEIKRLYKKDFAIGMKALGMIENKLGVVLPEDEGGFIALHLVNARMNSDMPETVSITNIVNDILNIIQRNFSIDIDEESLSYYRFLTHLKFFAKRIQSGIELEETDEVLHDMVKQQYPISYACAEKIRNYTLRIHKRDLSKDEMLYLTIHIERIVKA